MMLEEESYSDPATLDSGFNLSSRSTGATFDLTFNARNGSKANIRLKAGRGGKRTLRIAV